MPKAQYIYDVRVAVEMSELLAYGIVQWGRVTASGNHRSYTRPLYAAPGDPKRDELTEDACYAAVHGLGSAMFGDRHVKQVRHVEGDAWEIVTNTTEVIG